MKIKLRENIKSKSKNKLLRSKKKKKFLKNLCYSFDFGEYATKIAIGSVKGDKVYIKHLIVIENNEKTTRLSDYTIDEYKKIIIKELRKRNITPAKNYAMCTINCNHYISRELEIPHLKVADRQGLVAYEMSTKLELDIDTYFFNHKVKSVYNVEEEEMCRVWGVAVKKDICERYFKIIKSLKLKPIVMDVNINGVEALFNYDQKYNQQVSNQTVAVIDYGKSNTEISIFKKGKFDNLICLEIGEERLVQAAKSVLGVQITDIHNTNKLIVSSQNIYDILKQPKNNYNKELFLTEVEQWISEINISIKRYNLKNHIDPISKVYIYGGSLQLLWLKVYLEKYINVQVDIISNLEKFIIPDKYIVANNTIPQFLNALNIFLRK